MVILLIDDDGGLQERWRRWLERDLPGCTVVSAYTLAEAREAIKQFPNPDVISLDGSLEDPKMQLDTLPLVAEIRKTFAGPLIAASAKHSFKEKLMEAGCSHRLPEDKLWLTTFIVKLLEGKG